MSDVSAKTSIRFTERFLYRLYRSYYSIRRWRERHFSPSAMLAVGGLVAAGAIGLDTNLAMAYQAFTLLTCLLVVAALAVLFCRPPRLRVERRLPRFASVGVPLSYSVRITNATARFQRDVLLTEDHTDPRPSLEEFASSPEPGEAQRNWFDRNLLFYRWTWLLRGHQHAYIEPQLVPPVSPGGDLDIRMELTPTRRGVMRLTGVTLGVAEPFGLFQALRRTPLPGSLVVLPKRYPVPALALPGKRQYQQGGVAMAGSVGESDEFMSLRDYRPGDALRHIHWKSWARAGKPIVKEYEDEFFVRHALILDTFSTAAESEVFEAAVSVASSFACTIDTRESLLDLLFVGSEAYCFTAGRGLGYVEQLLSVLASVRTCRDKTVVHLERLVAQHAPAVTGSVCVLQAWDSPRQRMVQHLRGLGIPLLVCVVTGDDDPELDPGPMGDRPQAFRQLRVSRLEEGLAAL